MKRAYLYPTLLTLFFIAWSSAFVTQFSVTDAVHNWGTSLTMVLGSFVAGATPLGGGAVAFPVFTKLFGFEAHSAKVFSLAIQSVGMTFATIFFVSRGVRIYWSLLARLMPFALLGLACGFSLTVDGEPLKITFSFLLLACSYLLMQRCDTRLLQWRNSWSLYLIATLGGLLSAYIGAGADTLLFFYLVLRQKFDAKALIPTTVCFMAILSVTGSILLILQGQLSSAHVAFEPWFFAAPVVAIGAPLGGYVMSKINEKYVLRFIYALIFIEVCSTVVILQFSLALKVLLVAATLAVVVLALRQRGGILPERWVKAKGA